jgi:hypothetical protein|tara:strand:+ start:1017 stop:1337 length:321 start_codon:yes stop_codon:yes gene_type:complete
MIRADLVEYTRINNDLERRGNTIVAARREWQRDLTAGQTLRLEFYVDCVDIDHDNSCVSVKCTEYGKLGYHEPFSERFSIDEILDPMLVLDPAGYKYTPIPTVDVE